ncbi:MAG: aminoglycoside phosphotransferase family protein [Thermomicrobiales bacterium]
MTAQADIPLRDGAILPGTTIEEMLSHADTRNSRAWFESLPGMVDAWCDRWEIRLHPEVPHLTYNVVLFGSSATEGEVVLKLAPPGMEFASEVAGIRAFQGPEFVRLIHADSDAAGMLMERILPGTPLRAFDDRIDDTAATTIGASMLKHLWRPAPADPGDLIPLQRWFRDLFRLRDQLRDGRADLPISRDSVEYSATIAEDLLGTPDPVVLHGDMHHGNILENAAGSWTVIDPKGLIGDRAYDVGTWMLNGWPTNEPGDQDSIQRRRVDSFADGLDLPRERVVAGALVHATLVIAWACVESTAEEFTRDPWLQGTLKAQAIFERMAIEAGILA